MSASMGIQSTFEALPYKPGHLEGHYNFGTFLGNIRDVPLSFSSKEFENYVTYHHPQTPGSFPKPTTHFTMPTKKMKRASGQGTQTTSYASQARSRADESNGGNVKDAPTRPLPTPAVLARCRRLHRDCRVSLTPRVRKAAG